MEFNHVAFSVCRVVWFIVFWYFWLILLDFWVMQWAITYQSCLWQDLLGDHSWLLLQNQSHLQLLLLLLPRQHPGTTLLSNFLRQIEAQLTRNLFMVRASLLFCYFIPSSWIMFAFVFVILCFESKLTSYSHKRGGGGQWMKKIE